MLEFILTLDIGNTNKKVVLFDNQENFLDKFSLGRINEYTKKYNLNLKNTFACISSVKDSGLMNIPFKSQLVRTLLLHKKFLDMPVNYSSTIGDDRLANAYFIYKKATVPTLIIDAGTFLTIDIIDSLGFKGGYICPGITPLKLSYKNGENLIQHITKTYPKYSTDLPTNSEDAINLGAISMIKFVIEGIIKEYSLGNVIITGGTGEFIIELIEKYAIKNKVSIKYSPDLIHRSLCFIAKRIY